MSPSAAAHRAGGAGTSRAAADARRRRSAVRRRRLLFAAVVAGLVGLVVVLAMPTVRKAVNEFGLPLQDQSIIRQQAADKHLDPALIAAVIYTETRFYPRPSTAGAEGLMQIMPETAEFLAHRSGAKTFTTADLATPAVNIAYGSYYLRYLLDHYAGNEMLALAAYNGGEANVDRWIAAARRQGHQLSADEIPFPETRAYVSQVMTVQRQYRQRYATQLGYS